MEKGSYLLVATLCLLMMGVSSCSSDDDDVCIDDNACIEGEIVQVGEYGFFVVRATIGKEVLSEKVVIK